MRISDWSSDVCSSDLRPGALAHCHAGRHDANRAEAGAVRAEAAPRRDEVDAALRHEAAERDVIFLPRDDEAVLIVAVARVDIGYRSEQRRVGKECVSQVSSRWLA